jgi:fatty acid omega-hydroxylase
MVLGEEDIRHMLKDNWLSFQKNIPEIGFDIAGEELIGRSIFAVDGAEWKYLRKTASHLFSTNAIKHQMEQVFVSEGHAFVEILRAAAVSGETIDLQNVIQCLTFDAICEIAFGICPGALDAAARGETLPFLEAFDGGQRVLAERTGMPNFVWQVQRWLRIGQEGDMVRYTRLVREYVQSIIDQRKHEETEGFEDTRKDLLTLFISHGRKSGQQDFLSNAYLQDVILNFMVAGRDTTASTLINLFRLLAANPEEERRLINELASVPATHSGLNSANFLDAAINETLRIYPPVPEMLRIAVKDLVLPSGIQIRKRDFCMVPMLGLGRSPKLWLNPETFSPSRWLDSDGRLLKLISEDQYKIPIFWAGPRICLGKDMARFESKVIARLVLEELRIRPEKHDEAFMNMPVLFYKGGVPTRVELARTD